jgi:hypothetical protein
MGKDIVSTLKIGVLLQGDGGVSSGAMVLANKSSVDIEADVVLCYAPTSLHKFVTWTYYHPTGSCNWGHYFTTIQEAVEDFERRTL